MSSVPRKVARRLSLLRERFTYEKRRPQLAAAEVNRRVTAGAGIDASAPGGFSALLARHMHTTPPLPAPPAPASAGEDAAGPAGDIDWHREDHFGVAWPQHFVGAMSDHLDGSDVVLLWHKNKMMFLLDLAARYATTRDRAYSDRWFAAVDSWCRQNPYLVGMNWRSPMETGTRLVVWSRSLSMMKEAPLPGEEVCARIVRSVLRQGEFLASHFSAREVPNNHLIGEAATLYAFAARWPILRDAEAWMEKGETILVDEAARQILPDGMQYENAVNYHLYVLDFYLLYFAAAAERGATPPSAVRDRVASLLDAAMGLVSPAGRMPQIGDDSIEEFLAVAPSAWEDAGAATHTQTHVAARALLRAPFAAALETTDWGRALVGRTLPLERAHYFNDAGIAVFRTPRSHLVVAGGPQHARAYSPGHRHTDAGSFELEVDGACAIVDAGTYLYTYDPKLRDYFRGARAHNTVTVDGVDPGRPARVFAWESVHSARVTGVGSRGATGFVACECALPGDADTSFVHRRAIVQVPGAWLVADDVAPAPGTALEPGATPGHTARALLHTPLGAGRVVAAEGRKVGLFLDGGVECVVEVFSSGGHTVTLLDGAVDPAGLYSLRYGDLRRGTTIETSADVGAGCRLLHVIRGGDTSVDSLRWEETRAVVGFAGGGGVREVVVDVANARVLVDGVAIAD